MQVGLMPLAMASRQLGGNDMCGQFLKESLLLLNGSLLGCHGDKFPAQLSSSLLFLLCNVPQFPITKKPAHSERGEEVERRKEAGYWSLASAWTVQPLRNLLQLSRASWLLWALCLLCYTQHLINYCFTLMKEVVLPMIQILFTTPFL